MNYTRGSEWKKWDLHVHTPLDHEWINKPNIRNEEDYKNFAYEFIDFAKNENLSVLAIVDHNFCNNLEESCLPFIIEEAKQNNITVLPGFEITVTDGSGIHLLVIFKENTQLEKIYDITKQCFNPGKELIPSSGQIPISNKSLEQLKDLLEKSNVEYILIFAHADRENGVLHGRTINGGRRVQEWQKKFINIAQLSKNPNEFNPDSFMYKVINKQDSNYSRNITYIVASDCRTIDKNINQEGRTYLGQKYVWIKADPTFEGLKQIIYESEERVYIGEEPELLKRVRENSTKFIDKIKISWSRNYDRSKGVWFKDIEIPLNYGMVSIIGNKGNGKSALADIIALCGNSHRNKDDFSFLNKKRFLKRRLAENFKATLVWKNGEEVVRLLSDETDKNQVERVKYIPQGFFERLTNDIDKKEFEEEIENIVFSHLPDEDKLGKSNFRDLVNTKKSKLDKDIEILFKKLSDTNKEIVNLEKMNTPDYLSDLESKYNLKKEELQELKKLKPKKVKNPQEDEEISDEMKNKYEEIQKLEKDREQISKQIEDYSKKIKNLALEIEELNEIKSDFKALESNIKFTLQKIKDTLLKLNIEQNKIFSYKFDLYLLNQIIVEKEKEKEKIRKLITENYNHLNEDEENSNLQYRKFKVEGKIKLISKQISEPMRNYQKYLKDLEEWSNKRKKLIGNKDIPYTLLWLRNQIQFIKYNLKVEIEKLEQIRLDFVKEIFNKKLEIFDLYNQLKKVVDERISNYSYLMKDYEIIIDVSFKLNEKFINNFLRYINQRAKGCFKGKEEGFEQLKILIEQIENFNIRENIFAFLDLIMKNLKKESIVKQIIDLEEFYNFLFSLEYLEAYYELKLGNKSLSSLSPGERGALLIVFYLMLDKDNIPLIIDQPEENLDNESIYKILVHFIRDVKKRRQLIIVTHNPNLAIVGDSEQVIYVNLDKENGNTFNYKSGSIENREINIECSRILEGTIKAFNLRRLKYFKGN